MIFTQRLHNLGLTKHSFAKRVSLRPETVSRWREAPPPWALELVRAWEQIKRLTQERA